MGQDVTRLEGGCHCGNIRFVLLWPGVAADIPVRKCSCSFCRKRDGSWTSHPDARLAVEIADPSSVSKYRFGTRTADFHVCSVCGIVPFVSCEIDQVEYAVVDVRTFENVDISSLSSSSTDFDGEDTGSRLDRRKRNWIADVRITVVGRQE